MIHRNLRFARLLLPSHPSSSPALSKTGRNSRGFVSQVSSLQQPVAAPSSPHREDEDAEVEWDGLGFGLMPTDYMYVAKCSGDRNFGRGQLSLFGNFQVSPSAGVLNYGQGLFEGTKAYRKENGHLLLFRPEQNAIRMRMGAERMCMPAPSVDQFVNALKQTALANRRWEGTAPLNLYVEEDFDRASRRGTGSVKTISNYAPVLMAQTRAKNRGFSDVLYLDSQTKKNLEEVSSCNIFIAKGKNISTPATNGTILAGITRKSVIEIARDLGYQVEERVVGVDELAEADEVFCTGTAVGVAPVGNITYRDTRMEYRTGSGTICQELSSTLTGIQTGRIEDGKGWIHEIY
ncbi:branched-chain-amino-acid aminotransferase 2, chloroplastic-like isoform X2 [Neltuma alba]|uniref:branched-chain-amino-acid aminotransferase 2, chloroplastic-like isoform X2 n=1 Tax=Neltuma alba TaxID=207710 RepID=UPI0010A534CA|nr:branched-chain-amino-acid aminotransferase 2, chloroplastic-like isoform X2 [Prosopis alba]XP_028797240.1 branched-chain-amino-acid aminotransferase 2, chloroplastic-like isoform X2 [Prosopis alba]